MALYGCGSSSQGNTIDTKGAIVFSQFPEEQHLQEKKYFKIDDVEGQRMLLYRDSIVFMQRKPTSISPYHFAVFNLNTKKQIANALAYGRFPDEVMGFMACGTTDTSLWAYDIIKEQLFILEMQDILQGEEVKIKKFPMPTFYYSVKLRNNKELIASGDYTSDYKIAKIDLIARDVEKQFGKYAPDSLPSHTLAQKKAYESLLFVKPSGGKAVLATLYADRVEFFDFETDTTKVLKGPENFGPDMVMVKRHDGKEISTIGPDTRYGFVNGTVTNDFIYLLYSGYNTNSNHFIYGQSIYVYDWEGNPVKKIILTEEIVNFVVSSDDEKIYTYNPKTKYIMVANLY